MNSQNTNPQNINVPDIGPVLQPGPEGALGILPSLHAVMDKIKAVGKDGVNAQQKFNFRGIDGVMNAVGPVLRQHAVLLVPTVEAIEYGAVNTRGGAVMTTVRLRMRVSMFDMDGSAMSATVWGEAFDSGDKATAKAHSVALRTALIQMLALPTQEPDPDERTYERHVPQTEEEVLQHAETAERVELLQMMNGAKSRGQDDLAEKILAIGQRRFPPKGRASEPAPHDDQNN